LEIDPSDLSSKLYLANALHLSGDVEQAQILYEDLLSLQPGRAIRGASPPTVVPTARAALGRLKSGDVTGGETLIELVHGDLRQRSLAGLRDADSYRSAAIIAALAGNDAGALQNIDQAISVGLRDRGIFFEPAFEALHDKPKFGALESRLDAILASERGKALQLMCFDNPVPDAWQPLSETCEGVDRL
jgi:tetratricopeptide (TPR) repeat protein